MSYNIETVRVKLSADEWDGQQIGIWQPKKTCGMMDMQSWR